MHLEVKKKDGTVEKWMIEAGPPGALVRRGWKRDSVVPGTEVLVEGYQALDGTNKANGRDVTFPDGTRLFAGSSGTGAPRDGPIRSWLGVRTGSDPLMAAIGVRTGSDPKPSACPAPSKLPDSRPND
jgi:hypothetical protein